MTLAFLSSKPFGLGNAWVATASHRMLDVMFGPSVAGRHFDGSQPVPQCNGHISRQTDCAAGLLISAESNFRRKQHYPDFPSYPAARFRSPSSILDNKFDPSRGKLDIPYRGYTASFGFANCHPIVGVPQNPAIDLRAIAQRPDPADKPFMLLERVGHLLGTEQIQAARDLLQLGTITYPGDRKIQDLLRAITPGRIKRIPGTAPSRRKELDWIQRYGHGYRGLWVAISGDRLVASASTLASLLADLKHMIGKHDAPLIQHIAPENSDIC